MEQILFDYKKMEKGGTKGRKRRGEGKKGEQDKKAQGKVPD
jgi:hypothetical protein